MSPLNPAIADIEMPGPISRLPVHRGFPVPWFTARLEDGTPDFRYTRPGAVFQAVREACCWICGEPIPAAARRTYVVGPMCAINRTSAEPPSHPACARYSARACPFLARPHAARRTDGEVYTGPGHMIRRNPGVALLWFADRIEIRQVLNGEWLFNLPDPLRLEWYAEGREATRQEILESIDNGLPLLRDTIPDDDPDAVGAHDELDRRYAEVLGMLPA